jgi:hypothetical protein
MAERVFAKKSGPQSLEGSVIVKQLVPFPPERIALRRRGHSYNILLQTSLFPIPYRRNEIVVLSELYRSFAAVAISICRSFEQTPDFVLGHYHALILVAFDGSHGDLLIAVLHGASP